MFSFARPSPISALGLMVFASSSIAVPKVDVNTLTTRLQSRDSDERFAAVAEARGRIKDGTDGDMKVLANEWLPALLAAGMNAEVVELGQGAILAVPYNMSVVEPAQTARVKALLALGKPADALAEARRLYDVASMGGSGKAMDLFCEALVAADPVDGPNRARRFRLEQVVGATTRPYAEWTGSFEIMAAPKPDRAGTVLMSVQTDDAPYADAILQRHGTWCSELMGRGNLLLLGGRPEEALNAFRAAVLKAGKPWEIVASRNGVTRSLRAIDGNIGRANACMAAMKAELDAERPMTAAEHPEGP